MAKLHRLEKLFSAVASHDWAKARNEAMAIVGEEDAGNHVLAARRLRAALTHVSAQPATYVNGSGAFAISEALTVVLPAHGLDRVVLPPTKREELAAIVREWKGRERLSAANLSRRSKLLLHGPPGCGKSLSATALGFELGLPVNVVQLHAVVGSFLGQTAARVQALLRWAATEPSVLILDEIDAIARRRGKATDVAELDRVVVALLQELEHSSPSGLLVATTNRLDDLDEALFRRFDLVMEIPRPSRASL